VATYRRPRSTRLLVIGLVVTSLVTITVDFRGGETGPLAVVGRVGTAIVSPLQEGVSAVVRPVASFFTSLSRAGSIKAENDRLQEVVKELTAKVQFVEALEGENDAYRRELKLGDRLGYQLVGATVTGGSFGPNFDWAIQIDKGSADGVYEDMAVITGAGLVGRVVRVSSSTSTVMLIIDPQSAVAVRLGGNRELAALVGGGEEELHLEFVDPDAAVEAGERVVTASYRLRGTEEGVLPPQLPVGLVSQVIPQEGGTGPQVLVSPSVDFTTLETVALVRPSGSASGPGQPAGE
jgi:rod shape-determining protein MreC